MAFRNKSDKLALRDFFCTVVFSIFALTLFSISVSANVFINELMPSPNNVDWDLDGSSTSGDEWIELYNKGNVTINLTGWMLNDSSGKTFIIPSNATPILAANDFFVIYKNKKSNTYATQIELNNNGDTLSLYDNNSMLIDSMSYASNPGNDLAFGRTTDGSVELANLTYPTPDTKNGDCTVPKDDLYLVRNTTLCNGTYYASDANSDGFLVIFSDNLTLDFNGSILIGTDYDDIAQVWQGIAVLLKDNLDLFKIDSRNVAIINAKIMNFGTAIEATNTAGIEIKSSMFENNTLALELQNSNNTFVKNTYFKNSFKGITGFGLKDLFILSSIFEENENGVVLNYSSDALILDTKFIASLDDDIFLKHKTNLDILNASFSTLNFVDESDANATVKHYVVASVTDTNGAVGLASVSATDTFGNLVMSDTTDGFGKTSDGTVLTEYIQNATNTLSFNNHTFVINSTDPKHLLLQESREVDYSGEYVFTLSLEQIKSNVQITSPSDNAIVEGIVEFNVSVTDNAALNNVSFYVDGIEKQTLILPLFGVYSLSWNSSEVSDGNHTLKAVVFDTAGNSNSTEIVVQVNNVNLAPTITSIAITTATEDSLYQYDVDAADADPGDSSTFVFSLVTMPSGMTLNSTTGLITWTPSNIQTGNNNVTARVNDSLNAISEQQFTINVTAVNDAPVFAQTLVNLIVNEDSSLYYDINCTDEETTSLTYYENATQFTINSVSGNFTWTPTNDDVGNHNVNFICSDGQLNASQAITITVANTNDAPSLNTVGSNNTVEAVEDLFLVFLLSVSDDDTKNQENIEYFVNDTRFTITKVNNTLANITFLPTNNDVGKFAIKFSVNDLSNVSASLNVLVTVTNSNDAPVLNTVGTNNVVQATEDSIVAFTLTANDDDLLHGSSVGESLTYTVNDSRFTVTKVNNTLANVTFLPVNSDVPTTSVKFTVTDKNNTTSTQTVQINVTNSNDAPVITAFYPVFDNPKISELGMQMFNVSVSDVDLNDNLAFTWEAKDGNNNSFNSLLSVDASDNKKVNFTANGTTGNFVVKVSVKDLSNATATKTWTLTVADKPVASTFDSSLTTNFSTVANLSDVANVTLGKSVSGQPTQVLGLVSFKQNLDLSDVVDLDNFVNISKGFVRIDSKQLPQLNKSAKLSMQTLDFKSQPIIKVDLEDGNGFVNCPDTLCTNVSYIVNLTKDGSGALSFEVAHFTSYLASPNTTNVAPVIVSTPILTGKERSQYTYNVVAVDPNNDTLSYSLLAIANSSVIPQGMSLNNATGSISWLPVFGQNGTYSITLRVSDGNLSVNQSYNLTISAASRLSITEIKLKINDEEGDKKDTLVDGAKSRDIKPGQNVEVTVKIENLFTSSDFEINDVDVDGVLKDVDDDDDLDDEDEDIDLDAGDEEKAKLNFEIPVYADKGEYKLIVTASGRGTDGIDYKDNATVFLVVEKKNHELAITKAALTPPKVSCEYESVLQVVVNNLGKDQEDDGLLVIENSLLNLSIREMLDLQEGTGDSDDESIFSKFYPIKLSKEVEAGTYDLRLSTYYDKTHLSKEKSVQLVVEDCLEQKEAEVKQEVMEKPSEVEEQVVVVEKTAEEILASVPGFAVYDTIEEPVDTSFQTTLIIIALILLTGMGILLVGAFVIKHK